MNTATAVILEKPEQLKLGRLDLTDPVAGDVVVDIEWSGISTGTERLLWTGKMPSFPGMGYPLVPGYESVGKIVALGPETERDIGETVYIPGARCYGEVRGLFGGASSRVVVPSGSAAKVDSGLGEEGALMALAATAFHALATDGAKLPGLIIGHGVLGRLLARIAVALGGAPTVWETNAGRRDGAIGYDVVDPADDDHHDYKSIYDVSGDVGLLDTLISRLAPGGEVVLAGFYAAPLSFAFPPAFMKEARLRVAAEWKPNDLTAVIKMISDRQLSLAGLITHRVDATHADSAYRTAFDDAECLKMILDWRAFS